MNSELLSERRWNGKTGPVTRAIQKTFHDVIRGVNPAYKGWLEYVNGTRVPASLFASVSVPAD